MDNQFENQTTTPIEEDFSTVFSDPEAHKAASGKKKNRLIIAVASVLTVAVLVGIWWAVVKFIEVPEEEGSSSAINPIEVFSYDTDNIEGVKLVNKNGTFNFYSESETTADETTGEDITVTSWYLKGYDEELTDSYTIGELVEASVNIEAIREIPSKSDADCGLDSPKVKVEVTISEDEKYTVLVGDKSPDNAGVYVKHSKNNKIYLVGDELDELLTFTDLDLASTDDHPALTLDEKYEEYYSDDTLISFDSITLSGENFPEKMEFEANSDEELAAFTPYIVTKPTKRNAENVDILFSIFSEGFPVSGAYSYDVSKKTVDSLGLNSPDFEVSAKFGGYTYTYKFKLQNDGDYAVIGTDSKNIKRVSASDCTFLNYTTTDFYSRTVFMTQIAGVSNLTIKTEDKTYSFDIVENPSGDDVNKYIVECDGKTFNSSYFQNFYQFLCLLECMDFEVEKTSAEPELTLIYTYNYKNSTPTKVEFVKINATKYQYSVDGVAMGKIGSTSYKKIYKNLERLLDGKSITVN